MTSKIVVGYDGSGASERALNVAKALAAAKSDTLVVSHVLEWSAYSFLTPNELEERHKRRKEELSRAEEAVLKPLLAKLASEGISAESELRYGHIADTLCAIAKEHGAHHIVIGRTGEAGFGSRIFGSVAGSLAQGSPVPVTIVP